METAETLSDESSVNDVQIYSQVLEPSFGYLWSLRPCMKPSSISLLSPQIRLNNNS